MTINKLHLKPADNLGFVHSLVKQVFFFFKIDIFKFKGWSNKFLNGISSYQK